MIGNHLRGKFLNLGIGRLGHNDVAELLQFTLDNEKATDVALTEIAVSSINEQAAAE